MTEGVDPGQEGQQAWARVARWYEGTPRDVSGPLGEGDAALTALSDVGLVRRLLDRAEFEAVRAARKHGKAWAEIAIRLGVTRQSAWERWRDVDDAASGGDVAADVRASAAAEVAGRASEESAHQRRRRSSVVVPNVIGMSWEAARALLAERTLVAVSPDPDGPPLSGSDGVVTDQSPESGAKVPPDSRVKLWVERGGGSGVREPRRPRPDPKTGRKMHDEVTGETVG